MTAVIPLNNELVSEERDFACETTWKVVISRRFVVFTTTDRMKCCSYWENGDEREVLNHCTRLLYVWFPSGNYLIFWRTSVWLCVGNPVNLLFACAPVDRPFQTIDRRRGSFVFGRRTCTIFSQWRNEKTGTTNVRRKTRLIEVFWEGKCALLVLYSSNVKVVGVQPLNHIELHVWLKSFVFTAYASGPPNGWWVE